MELEEEEDLDELSNVYILSRTDSEQLCVCVCVNCYTWAHTRSQESKFELYVGCKKFFFCYMKTKFAQFGEGWVSESRMPKAECPKQKQVVIIRIEEGCGENRERAREKGGENNEEEKATRSVVESVVKK